MEKEYQKNIVNNFEPGCNCQVYNAPISGCVFAMPGANITQYPAQSPTDIADDEQDVIDRLKPMFYGDAENAKAFLQSIQGMKQNYTQNRNQIGTRESCDSLFFCRYLSLLLVETCFCLLLLVALFNSPLPLLQGLFLCLPLHRQQDKIPD